MGPVVIEISLLEEEELSHAAEKVHHYDYIIYFYNKCNDVTITAVGYVQDR